jgi:uncharacterized OB-fold protein
MGKITVTERRCKRCGAIQVTPPPNGLCPKCTAWKAKQNGN